MKQDSIAKNGTKTKVTPKPVPRASEPSTERLIMDAIEQSVVYWSAAGLCELHNRQTFDVLEVDSKHIGKGTPLEQFLTSGRDRGEFSSAKLRELLDMFQLSRPFQYDCTMPSSRVVSAKVRPMRGGGHVVTFSDVTEPRRAVAALNVAKAEAEAAERKASEVLEDERARQREASLLAQLDEWLQACKSLNELFEIVTTFMRMVLPGTRGQLFIYSNSRDVLEVACAWNCDSDQDNVAPDSCWALRRGRSYTYQPDELCFVCDHVKDAHSNDKAPEIYLCVPIVAHGDTVGLLHLEFEDTNRNLGVIDAPAFITRCGEHISMAIANVKLRDELQDQSTRDPLTGLFNRRYFMNALSRELSQTASRQGNFALLSVDADKFKVFNDEHGHDAGDVVLEGIAEKMLELDAEGAVVCRVGGEEFSILLPTADRAQASAVAEELRVSIAEMRVKYVGGPLPKVTVSTGIAVYPTHGAQAKDLIKAADLALYVAKKEGRDRCKVADGDGKSSFDDMP
jgi:diguanylate cyclase (GGDEF)-like protein